ncbi:hypothetical protein E2C01_100576 [Portunus trituberculatus]|uniref:Uncharacterized protein n=1 Tax=Portunus trituberculatus TaxID=210409 RepID=A0A5B7KJT9_PORTR|nr:hypothetical protein [Portunus trituberculatus]
MMGHSPPRVLKVVCPKPASVSPPRLPASRNGLTVLHCTTPAPETCPLPGEWRPLDVSMPGLTPSIVATNPDER